MMKRICALLTALVLLTGAALAEGYRIDPRNASNFGKLLIYLLHAYERPASDDASTIAAALDAIRDVSLGDYEVVRAISDHWGRVYLNAEGEYLLNLYDGGERATALEATGLKDSPTHAFVVLGFELKDGRMTPELAGRCDAAAAAARSFPSAILVCSGGPTGKNNPQNHTEAGLMKRYLVEKRGIDAGRIFIDEKAMSTVQNAVNTFEILRAQGIETITIVTSSYHQRWGQVIYNAMSALYRQGDGYSVRIVENYCYDIAPSDHYRNDDRFAVRQLTSVLQLSDKVIEEMKKAF